MMRLKANKTSLYKLVHYYTALPRMKETQFAKLRSMYCLTWTNAYGLCCKAVLGVFGGKPSLVVTWSDPEGNEVSREDHDLELSDLRDRGMVEEVYNPVFRQRVLNEEGL